MAFERNVQLQKNYVSASTTCLILDLARVCLLAPIQRPPKDIFCVGLNYLDHIAEGDFTDDDKAPDTPEYFTKPLTCGRAHNDSIPPHAGVTAKLDYEGELGVVIGKRGTNIDAAHWRNHVFGYTIINDVTGRDLQFANQQWFKGKSLDGSCPMGPYIVTADEVGDPQAPRIRTRVNGEFRQDESTSKMIFGVGRILEELSKGLTLDPGDVIATGTPGGIGYTMKPPRFLAAGDEVRISIERIGELVNRIG